MTNDDFELAAVAIADEIDWLHARVMRAAEVGFAKAVATNGAVVASDCAGLDSLAEAISQELEPAVQHLRAKAQQVAERVWRTAAGLSKTLARATSSNDPVPNDSQPNTTATTQDPNTAA